MALIYCETGSCAGVEGQIGLVLFDSLLPKSGK
jgi:hypothetical protein